MSDLQQITFMGASVRGYASSIGWDNQVSQLTVSLVEDDTRGDIINFPEIGTPVYFIHDNFYFAGLFQNGKATQDVQGCPLYEAVIVDPRELLDGVQLILNNYIGGVNLPNLINVYGYLENQSYGSSQVNPSGMPWKNIIRALSNTINSNRGIFGGPVTYKGRTFQLDLSRLPNIPSYYRVGGDNISLSDFINDICQAGNCKYFVRLNGGVIEVHTVSHQKEPVPGAITRFVSQTSGAVSKNIGIELRNETVNKFVVGGAIEQIYIQNSDSGASNDYEDDTIWPYWGLDRYGNAILGRGFGDDHYFTLDTRHLGIKEIGDYYTTNVGEMRAALEGKPVWEAFLVSSNYNKFKYDEQGEYASVLSKVEDYMQVTENPTIVPYDQLVSNQKLFYRHDKVLNPHYLKASKIRIQFQNIEKHLSQVLSEADTPEKIESALKNINPKLLSKPFFINRRDPQRDYNEEVLDIIYQFVSGIAQEYYGKKFMVKIPFTYTLLESETNSLKTSQEPTDAGFVEESQWANAIQANLLPYYIDSFLTPENKIYPYVRYDNAHLVDFSEVNPSDIGFNSTVLNTEDINLQKKNVSAFVRIAQKDRLVFLDRNTLYSPRLVIELPGNVKQKVLTNTPLQNTCMGLFMQMVADGQKLSESVRVQIINILANSVGGEDLKFFTDGPAIMPTLAGVAIRSNIQNYGPWTSQGGDGRTEFERDESLVPWNYNGYALMNLAGNAKVLDVSRQTFSESGDVEFPGFPTLNLGDLLTNGGPYITDIRVSGGTDGFKTTYSMRIWTPKFGKLAQANINRLLRIAKVQQDHRREFRRLNTLKPPDISLNRFQNTIQKNLQKKIDQSSKKSFSQITAQIVKNEETGLGQVFCSVSDGVNNSKEADNVGSITMDGLFIPVSQIELSGIPSMEAGSGDINSASLNPYSNTSYMRDNFPVSHRGPLVLTGWGYDIEDNPVPGSGGEFTENYKNRPDLWKAGPVDLRWDDTRKVWTGKQLTQDELNEMLQGVGLPKKKDGKTDTCSKLKCIDIGSINSCEICDAAPQIYNVYMPTWNGWEDASGDIELIYSNGCVWNSMPFFHPNSGVYFWSLDLEE